MGIFYAVCAYILWGVLPIFWKQLQHIPNTEIMFHRMLWTFCTIWLFLLVYGKWQWLEILKKDKKQILYGFIASVCIISNWFVFVWSINSGYIVEASLGYFINPLLFVLMGVVFLGEKLRKVQMIAIVIAAMGVLYLTIVYGSFPTISLFIAFTFTIYGLIRKAMPLKSFEGLALEMLFAFIPALLYLFYIESSGTGAFLTSTTNIKLLLVATGIITAIPLSFFAAAAKALPMYTLGFFQYIAPSLQFFLGVFVYHESFSNTKLIGFIFIWVALFMYSLEAYCVYRKKFSAT